MAKYSGGLEDSLNIPEPSVTVLEKRYLKKDSSGKLLETGEDLLRRVAKDIAAADAFYMPEFKERVYEGMPTQELYQAVEGNEAIKKREDEFFEIMRNRYFLPNSPTLMNAGRELQQLSACFVLPIGDSMEDIFETLKDTALIHKSGGGTGFSFSRLRPNGAYIHSTGSYTAGPITFLRVYDAGTEAVKQGGTRRGANMGIMRANHPDALDWITIKEKTGVLSNFNLSIALSDNEIRAIKEDGYILMEDPRGAEYTVNNAEHRTKEIELARIENYEAKFRTSWDLSEDRKSIIDTASGKEIGKVEDGKLYIRAKALFDKMVDKAWKNGDPGVVFIDKMNEGNPTPEIGMIESTNPCGEQPLLPYESCNLGSINLAEMVDDNGEINESLLEKTVRTATRFLDNVIDRNNYPLKEIEKMTKANRKIGLGVMGFANMLIRRGISYNSEEAIKEGERVMKFINDVSKDESRKLAKERGAFPNFDKSIYKNEEPIRNATRTTIAPTGTISIILGASSGIEPIFSYVTVRNVTKSIGKKLVEINEEFEKFLVENIYGSREALYADEKLESLGDWKNLENMLIPLPQKKRIKEIFVTAHDVPVEQHIKMQAAFQRHTDNAVSKTINMPNSATREDVANAYLMAYDLGCKGITIYRDGSRMDQVLNKSGNGLEKKTLERGRDRKEVIGLHGITYEVGTGCGPLFVTINYDEQGPVEIFSEMNPQGGCAAAQTASTGILSSLGLHKGVRPEQIRKHFKAIRCPEANELLNKASCSQAVSKALEFFARDYEKIKEKGLSPIIENRNRKNDQNQGNPEESNQERIIGLNKDKLFCPDCNSRLNFESGCSGGTCFNPGCGYSSC